MAPPVADALGVRRRIDAETAVALTFDDGPHPEGTPAALDALAAAGARATFFLVGEQVRRFPELAAEVVARGHAVALHCDRHRNLLRLTPRAIRADLERAAAAVADATGRRPRLQRPPYGIFSAAGLRAVRGLGLAPLLWSKWGRDWTASATAESVATLALDGIGPGDVVLLHDADHYSVPGSWRATVAALPPILDRLQVLGLETVTL